MSSAPPQGWPPPNPAAAGRPGRQVRPERRRLGWALIGVGAVIAVVTLFTAGREVWRGVAGFERTTMPGSVTIDCREGEEWRVGPATGSSSQFGPVNITTSNTPLPIEVSVVLGGAPVTVMPMQDGQETFEYFGSTYTATLTFECPTYGAAVVSLDGPDGQGAAVFPSFWKTFRSLLVLGGALALALAVTVPGIVLAVRHRRPRQYRA